MFNFIIARLNERKAIRALSCLSDRDLNDVGIARDSIGATVRLGLGTIEEPVLAQSWAVQDRRSLSA